MCPCRCLKLIHGRQLQLHVHQALISLLGLLTFRWPLREKEEPAQLQVASKQGALKKKTRKRKKKTKLFNLFSTITALQKIIIAFSRTFIGRVYLQGCLSSGFMHGCDALGSSAKDYVTAYQEELVASEM